MVKNAKGDPAPDQEIGDIGLALGHAPVGAGVEVEVALETGGDEAEVIRGQDPEIEDDPEVVLAEEEVILEVDLELDRDRQVTDLEVGALREAGPGLVEDKLLMLIENTIVAIVNFDNLLPY